jgi:predicted nucleic acid-binding protein
MPGLRVIVLDTNVLVSGLTYPGGVPRPYCRHVAPRRAGRGVVALHPR